MESQNYTLGRGKIYFSRFKTGTQTPAGFNYIGNTPEFSLTIESENLDHFSSDEGIREKDDSVPLQVTRSGSMTTDSIRPSNVALFFFGDSSIVTTVGGSGMTETLTDVLAGHAYKLGVSDTNPAGYFGIDEDSFSLALDGAVLVDATGALTVSSTGPIDGETIQIGDQIYTFRATPTDPYDIDISATPGTQASNIAAAINAGAGAGTVYGTGTIAHPDVEASVSSSIVTITAKVGGTAGNSISLAEAATNVAKSAATLTGGTGVSYIEGTDYTVDYDLGVIEIAEDGAISDGADIDVFFGIKSSTRTRVISGSTPVEGAMMYVAKNPKGEQYNYMLPWVKITPNGDYALKGDEWQTIPFSLEVLKRSTVEAIYVDGAPAFV